MNKEATHLHTHFFISERNGDLKKKRSQIDKLQDVQAFIYIQKCVVYA